MIILDASVIAKRFLSEDDSKKALVYRDLHSQRKEAIFIPSIALYELANLFRYKKELSEKEIEEALEILNNFQLQIINPGFKELIRVAIFAREKDVTVYDAVYILLASDFRCDFITADRKLFNKIKDLNFVKLL